MIMNLDGMPIVQTGTLQGFVIGIKAQRAHQMEMRSRSGAGPRNITGIRRNFRLHQHNMKSHNCHLAKK
ncbi:hypothetical protein D3C72_2333280 [compost metagenome]